MPENCVTCGTCCFSESDEHARVTGDDHSRLGEEAERLVQFLGNRAFMRLDRSSGVGHCAALVLDPLEGTFRCSVYAQRPAVCRELDRGGPACEGELAMKRDRPGRALVQLGRARPQGPIRPA